jgi:hypothetical protein
MSAKPIEKGERVLGSVRLTWLGKLLEAYLINPLTAPAQSFIFNMLQVAAQ